MGGTHLAIFHYRWIAYSALERERECPSWLGRAQQWRRKRFAAECFVNDCLRVLSSSHTKSVFNLSRPSSHLTSYPVIVLIMRQNAYHERQHCCWRHTAVSLVRLRGKLSLLFTTYENVTQLRPFDGKREDEALNKLFLLYVGCAAFYMCPLAFLLSLSRSLFKKVNVFSVTDSWKSKTLHKTASGWTPYRTRSHINLQTLQNNENQSF